ncbi:hypothetical protein H4R33_000392 [Dimargaris cristalligena]|nr:hypothetical protein H4R33_000392 [Dimargaris cristalligena]
MTRDDLTPPIDIDDSPVPSTVSLLTSALAVLENQLQRAQFDLAQLRQAKEDALLNPLEFVEQLKSKRLAPLPGLQRIIRAPDIDWAYLAQPSADLRGSPPLVYRSSRGNRGVFQNPRFPDAGTLLPPPDDPETPLPSPRPMLPQPPFPSVALARSQSYPTPTVERTPSLPLPPVRTTSSQRKPPAAVKADNRVTKKRKRAPPKYLVDDDLDFDNEDFYPSRSRTSTPSRSRNSRPSKAKSQTESGRSVGPSGSVRTSGYLYNVPLASTQALVMSDDDNTIPGIEPPPPLSASTANGESKWRCAQCRRTADENQRWLCLDCPADDNIQVCDACRVGSARPSNICGRHLVSHRLRPLGRSSASQPAYYHDQDYAQSTDRDFGY